MGRPAWANDAQWAFLSAQAERYIPIKGTKATKEFWPELFDGWMSKWPNIPLDSPVEALTDPSEGDDPHDEPVTGDSLITHNGTPAPASEHPQSPGEAGNASPSTRNDSTVDDDLSTKTSQPTKNQASKSKKGLTYRVVSTRVSVFQVVCLIDTTEVEAIHKQPHTSPKR